MKRSMALPVLEITEKPEKKAPFKIGKCTEDCYDYNPVSRPLPSKQDFPLPAEQNGTRIWEAPNDFSQRTGQQLLNFVDASYLAEKKAFIAEDPGDVERQIGDKFFETSNCVFYGKGKDKIRLSNFIVRVVERIYRKKLDSTIKLLKVNIRSVHSEVTLEIPLVKFKQLLVEIKNDHPEFHLNAGLSSASSFFAEYCSLIYEEAMETLCVSTVYEYPGWENVDGKMIYLSGSMPICVSERYVWDIAPHLLSDVYLAGLDFLSVGRDMKTILPLFLYAHMGFTAELFKQAGQDVQFVLMLMGESNSFKTALSKELFQPFGKGSFLNFQSTPRAIELQRNESRDMTLLLDDLFSSKDSDALKKFETVLRTFGDNVARGTADPTSTKINRFDVRGGAVVTGENDLPMQQSSSLRYLTVRVDKTSFLSEKLRYFQSNRTTSAQNQQPSILQAYFSAYIHFLEDHYLEIVGDIATSFANNNCPQIKFPRLSTAFKSLLVTSQLITRFGLFSGALSSTQAQQCLSKWEGYLLELILENQNDSMLCEPYIAFLDALMQGIASGDIPMAETKDAFFNSTKEYIGYSDKDGEKMYLNPQKVFKYIDRYYADMRKSFVATESDILSALLQNGISEGYKEKTGQYRKVKKVSHGKIQLKMLCLKRPAVDTALENKY